MDRDFKSKFPTQEVLSTQIDNGLVEPRFALFRTETRGTASDDFGNALNLVNLLAEPQTSVT